MQDWSYNLPTLHRPTVDGRTQPLSRTGGQPPIPTPPHRASEAARPATRRLALDICSSYRPQTTVPNMMTEKDWQAYRAKRQSDDLPELDDFTRSYLELSFRRAYRHPHPGFPKDRKGCIGGSWRHMKEAIGYGPGRLMWVDGIITLYDDGQSLNKEKPWERSAPFAAIPTNRKSAPPYGSAPSGMPRLSQPAGRYGSRPWYSSNRPQPLLFAVSPPAETAPEGKYKGFYSMAQTYA